MDPKKFVDTKGRTWQLEIGWPAFLRVKALGIDLDTYVPKKAMTAEEHQETVEKFLELIYSSSKFPGVLVAILEPQLKAAGVSDADFADGFETVESIEAVTKAFRHSLADFIRDPLRKALFAKAMLGVERMQILQTLKLDANTEKMLAKMEREAETKIDAELLKILSTNSPEPSTSGLTTRNP
jgi:hypothetical protein